jgi:hypothetical protein
MHILINVSVSSLSFFLAFKLNNLTDSNESVGNKTPP